MSILSLGKTSIVIGKDIMTRHNYVQSIFKTLYPLKGSRIYHDIAENPGSTVEEISKRTRLGKDAIETALDFYLEDGIIKSHYHDKSDITKYSIRIRITGKRDSDIANFVDISDATVSSSEIILL